MREAINERQCNILIISKSKWVGGNSIQNKYRKIEMWSKFGKEWIVCKQIVRRSLVFDQTNQTTIESAILREVGTGKQGEIWCS